MIKLTAIIIKDKSETLISQYPENHFFLNQEMVDKYESYLRAKWSAVFARPVSVLLSHRQRPEKLIKPLEIFISVGKQMGLGDGVIFQHTKKNEVTRARKYAVMICDDLDFSHSEIENGTPLKNRVGYYYIGKLKSEFSQSEEIRLEYEDIKDRVVKNLYEIH